MRKIFSFVVAAALSAPALLWAEEAVPFLNVYRMDAEYQLDRRMGEFPAEARERFWSSENAYRISGGSLNIRHLTLTEDLKARFTLLEEKFWLRFRHRRRQGLERDDRSAEVELEWSPSPPWSFSLLGEPAFHKSEAAAGLGVRWGASEGRSVNLSYHWPGFDGNYAFSNQSIDEGFSRFYRRAPQEARLEAVWTGGDLSARLEGRLGRGWEGVTRHFDDGESYVDAGAGAEGLLDVRLRRGPWIWAFEGEAWRERRSRRHEPQPLPQDRAVSAEAALARAVLERAAGSWRWRGAFSFSTLRGALRQAAAPALDDGYKIVDRIVEATAFRRSGKSEWEGGLLYDRQWWEAGVRASTAAAPASQNRGKAGWRYDFSPRAFVALAAAVELDRGQSEAFFSFDGGTVVFQASF